MTLAQAIKHSEEVAADKNVCKSCRREHALLTQWLRELAEGRKARRELHRRFREVRKNEIQQEKENKQNEERKID